jgi:hypothetical protein
MKRKRQPEDVATRKVVKRQQGFQLPEEVISWLNDEEGGTGVTLSRLALAALCAYMLEDDWHRRSAISVAMAVERGELSFRNLRREWLCYRHRLLKEGSIKGIQAVADDPRRKELEKRIKETYERENAEIMRRLDDLDHHQKYGRAAWGGASDFD